MSMAAKMKANENSKICRDALEEFNYVNSTYVFNKRSYPSLAFY